MSARTLNDGIQAIRAGNLEEGSRLLRIAIKDQTLDAPSRAVGLMWLAETHPDIQFKIQCYQQAIQIDPQNTDLTNRLNLLLAQANPQPPAHTPPANPNAYPPNYGQNTPSQGIPPANPNAYPPNYGQNTPSQGMPPANPNAYPPNYGQNTPSQGMPPANPNAYPPNYGQNTPSQGMPPANQGYQTYGPQGIQPANRQEERLHFEDLIPLVAIHGGPNGQGSGFFMTREGLIVTTRYVVGGAEQVQIEIPNFGKVDGSVVRSFPQYDVALIQTNLTLGHLLKQSRSPDLLDNQVIIAITYPNSGLESVRRTVRGTIPPHWFPTMINYLEDAGGNPVIDDKNQLVGMMTKNVSRTSSFLYGIHLSAIRRLIDTYQQELQQLAGTRTTYCFNCGIMSLAPSISAYYCEHCGTTLAHAIDIERRPQAHANTLYGNANNHACPNCQSRAGFYNNMCLRCGFEA